VQLCKRLLFLSNLHLEIANQAGISDHLNLRGLSFTELFEDLFLQIRLCILVRACLRSIQSVLLTKTSFQELNLSVLLSGTLFLQAQLGSQLRDLLFTAGGPLCASTFACGRARLGVLGVN